MAIKVIILAAGESKRLGCRPKQLVPYGDTTLLGYTINVCLQAGVGPVTVVLGANERIIQSRVDFSGCDIEVFDDWYRGMGASIGYAMRGYSVRAQEEDPDYDGVLITVADQPYLTTSILRQLAEVHESHPSSIIISRYLEAQGPPSIFPKRLFDQMANLSGDDGAKSIIINDIYAVKSIRFDQGHLDIDTPEDLPLLE